MMLSLRPFFFLSGSFCALFWALPTICAATEFPDLSQFNVPSCTQSLKSPRTLQPLGKKLSRMERARLVKEALEQGKLELYREKENFKVYKIRGKDLPAKLLYHLGVLREQAFRQVEEGSGKSSDTDEFDLRYDHLLVWNAEEQDIVGAYRLGSFEEARKTGNLGLMYTHSFFHFTPKFFTHFDGGMVEMGRSFVVPKYQNHGNVLALLWGGIAEYLYRHEKLRYLCGPVSLSGSYSHLSKTLIKDYFMKHYGDTQGLGRLVTPSNSFSEEVSLPTRLREEILENKLSDFNRLIESLEGEDKGIPPLIKHYSGLLNAKFIETSVDPDFNTLDFLICVDINDLNPRKAEYFVGDKAKAQALLQRFR